MADDTDKPAVFMGVDGKWYPEGYSYGVDGRYHHASLVYKPGINAEGEYVAYRAESSPMGVDGHYYFPGSFLGVDGQRHPADSVYGIDGRYHDPPPTK